MNSIEFEAIENLFIENKDEVRALKMKAYLKDRFELLGIMSPKRKEIMRSIFLGYKWTRESLIEFNRFCWKSNYRELQYAGLDMLHKHSKLLKIEDIPFLEGLVTEKSWWDTVDSLAVNPIGITLKQDKEQLLEWVTEWMDSDNMWLRRTAILHQLKYKEEINVTLMEMTILKANGTKEFFLNKAIGWMLREYARIDPDYVQDFCATHDLSNLSKREALKHFK